MIDLLRALFVGGTPRERSAVRWLVAGVLVVVWAAVFTWGAFALGPRAAPGSGWVETSPCHFRWMVVSEWTGRLVSDEEALTAGCPHRKGAVGPY